MMGQRTGRVGRRLATIWLVFVGLLALAANFIANDLPIACTVDGAWHFPVLTDIVDEPQIINSNKDWRGNRVDRAVWPLIRYDGKRSDLSTPGYQPPTLSGPSAGRAPHYLGTDALGKDVAATLVRGARTAATVGVGATLLALVLGICLGAPAGFFGNHGWRASRAKWLAIVGGVLLGGGFAVICLVPFLEVATLFPISCVILFTMCTVTAVLNFVLGSIKYFRQPVAFPVDTVVLQLVEVFTNIPGLVILIAATALLEAPTTYSIMVIIGLLSWPRVVRFLRAELIRVRSLPYIESAYAGGIPKWRILFRHALPNALGPLLVLTGFMVGGAILLEAFLSFLGLGLPPGSPTWGSLLRRARDQPEAWWLALFPGLMLTLTILSLQILVDGWRPRTPRPGARGQVTTKL